MTTAQPPQAGQPARRSRVTVVKPGRMPVSELAFDRAGAASPFGDDVTFPLPTEQLTYQHPEVPGPRPEPSGPSGATT